MVSNQEIKHILSLNGTFTWSFSDEFFIETAEGNFIWSDPDYGGDNTLKRTKMSCGEWIRSMNIPYGRDKGVRMIGGYVGDKVTLVP